MDIIQNFMPNPIPEGAMSAKIAKLQKDNNFEKKLELKYFIIFRLHCIYELI